MVERIFFACATCATAIACRTQFGHGKEQIYLFPCPNCGVTLGFTLLIDRKNLSWKYDSLNNLIPHDSDKEPEILLNFSSDFLVRKNMADVPPEKQLTPFLENMGLVADREVYLENRRQRLRAVMHFWPSLERAKTHCERNDEKKFYAELASLGLDQVLKPTGSGSMRKMLAEVIERYWQLFSPHLGAERRDVIAKVTSASVANKNDVDKMRRWFRDSDRAEQLFLEMRGIDRQWAELYPFLAPLELVEHLKAGQPSLSETFTLSEKPIDRLKAFHSDCFETLGRILVIAGGYEGIVAGHGVGMPSRKRVVPLDEFESMPNGTKPSLLASMAIWPLFAEVFDSKLRNGIGHNSFFYKASTDRIEYQNQSKTAGRQEFEMAFLDFCIRTRRIYHLVTVAGIYVHSVWIQPSPGASQKIAPL